MMEKDPTQIRLELAQGHWALGEYDDALACLERVEGGEAAIKQLLEHLLEGEANPDAASRLRRALEQLETAPGPPLATPTIAKLLEEQGHEDKALMVVEDVLRRNPDDERARAVRERLCPEVAQKDERRATIERWLDYFQQRMQGETHL
jgi:tetratricopeptide (TPR) repeat protein